MQEMEARAGTTTGSRLEMWSWAFYDWAGNSYATIVLTFVFAAYYARQVAEDQVAGGAQWAVTLGIAGAMIALGAPLLGAVVDQSGRRKPWLAAFTLLCVAATALLWFVRPAPRYAVAALVLVALGEVGMEYAAVLYNAMLPRLADKSRIGRWSGWGWSMGYAGGLLALAAALLLVEKGPDWLGLNPAEAEPVRATFLMAAAWYAVFAVPLFVFVRDEPSRGKPLRQAAREGAGQLRDSIRNVRRYAAIVRFLIARLVYTDGLSTVFIFGGVYAAGTFNMSPRDVLLFGIAINVSAGIGAASFAWIDDRLGSKQTILLSLLGIMIPAAVIVLAHSKVAFWIFSLILGLFVGPVQAAGRSYMSHAAPETLRNQMFGLLAFSGKAAFLCPVLVGAMTYFTGSQRAGISVTLLFFAAGFALMLTVPDR